jgi:hypothetical protein
MRCYSLAADCCLVLVAAASAAENNDVIMTKDRSICHDYHDDDDML